MQQLRNFRHLAFGYGQLRSMRDAAAVDAAGAPIPWYTYPALEFLRNLRTEELTAFEFGSGNSSLWWSHRVRHLTSVEDNDDWFSHVGARIDCATFRYLHAKGQGYSRSILAFDAAFDIVIIDGIDRPQCALAALSHIRRFGGRVVILDNSDWYPATARFLTDELGWVRVDFNGFGPINAYTWTTSVWINQASVDGLYKSRLEPSHAAVNGQCAADLDFEASVHDGRLPTA